MNILLNYERASQFKSFDSLKGLKDALKLQEKIIDNPKSFEDDYFLDLDKKIKNIKVGDNVILEYYYDFEYISTKGKVKKIDYDNKVIYLLESKIYFDDIVNIIINN